MTNYDHQAIEKKWQNFWLTNKTFQANKPTSVPPDKGARGFRGKFYALDMFPYPSGAGLHVGHPLGYTATDIISRKKRMEGYEVLHPIGWDAFGLPAENYAIKTGVHPQDSTQKNIANFRRQIQELGFSYDWDREVDTTDPNYYRWSQWIFLQLYKKGLAYQEEKPMNWCPHCQVVCANEEVEQGIHERCEHQVEKKELKQWMFRITDYAERLLQDLEKPNIILIHGLGGRGDSGWFAEMKKYLEDKGITVFSPNFPQADKPQYADWKKYFEENLKPYLQRNTVLIGHSLGGGFIQRYLTEEDVQISEIALFAPTVNDCGIAEISNFFASEFDYEKIKNSADNIFILGGGQDPYIDQKDLENLAKKLDAHWRFAENEEHFWSDKTTVDLSSSLVKDFFEKLVASQLDWPEKIKAMQKNWIGKSEGAEVDFAIENFAEKITVFTTRPDTLFGATYFVLAPEHPLVNQITTPGFREKITAYQKECANKSELERTELNKDKTGEFTGAYAINPVNGKLLPIWIADYVMTGYGTGAIMAVPAHDERDFEFAQKYNLEIIEVVDLEDPFQKSGGKMKNSEFLDGLPVEKAIAKMIEFLEQQKIGQRKINYKLRDWIFTRQRYWGEPIPLVFDENGKCYPLADSELPLKLPNTPNYQPSNDGQSPLAKVEDWVNVRGEIQADGTVITSAKGSTKFTRETSTMPNWAGSSWYWLRYMDPQNSANFCSPESEKFWGPVDLYVGGAEHAVLHLLYARFWHKVLYDLDLVSTKEPFKKLVNQGLITSYAYQRANKSLVPTDEVEEINGEFIEKNTGEKVTQVIAKMSKSLKNVVNPDEIIEKYGADTLRMYEMFMGPFKQSKPWDTGAVNGIKKFLDKVWRNFAEKEISETCPAPELVKLTHQTVKKVGEDIDEFKFNTAISQMMIWLNEFAKLEKIPRISGGKFIRLLAPFAPHLCEELWQKFKPESATIAYENWPSYQEELLAENEVVYAIQVNGKVRGNLKTAKDTPKEEVINEAKKVEKVAKYLATGEIKKEIFVPEKIVGFVVK